MQAHDREILAVAYSPAVDHLLLTGSADNVRPFAVLRTKANTDFDSVVDNYFARLASTS